MGALLLLLLKGFLIFLGICVAIILVSMAVGTLEILVSSISWKRKK